jgi:hypothetical protein
MSGRQNIIDREQGAALEKRARIESFWLARPWLVVGVTLAICAAAALQFRKVYFNYNLLDMQSKGLASVVYEKKLLYSGKQSVLFAALIADSLEQAREYEEKVKKLPAVASVDGDDKGDAMFDLLTRDPRPKLQLVRSIRDEVSDLHFAEPDPSRADTRELAGTLFSTMAYLALAADEVEKEKLTPVVEKPLIPEVATTNDTPDLVQQLRSLRRAISDFRVKMLSGDPGVTQRLTKYQEALFADIHDTFDAIKTQDTSSGLHPGDLPPALHNRFIGMFSQYRVLVFPKKDVWQHENQREFINQLRSVIPEERVTGTPVQLFEYTTLLKDSYEQAALYSLVAIAILVLLHFRSVVCVILALLPVAIGTTWMVGFMGRTGIPFNPANIMTLPLVIGIGVTNGIHILNRFAEERNAGILAKSTGKAVLVSGLTAMTGFGSLILAKHQGIQSLGFVMSVGIATCMIAGLTFLPALLNILVKWGWKIETKKTQ